jgi:hypothetical protein
MPIAAEPECPREAGAFASSSGPTRDSRRSRRHAYLSDSEEHNESHTAQPGAQGPPRPEPSNPLATCRA